MNWNCLEPKLLASFNINIIAYHRYIASWDTEMEFWPTKCWHRKSMQSHRCYAVSMPLFEWRCSAWVPSARRWCPGHHPNANSIWHLLWGVAKNGPWHMWQHLVNIFQCQKYPNQTPWNGKAMWPGHWFDSSFDLTTWMCCWGYNHGYNPYKVGYNPYNPG